MWQRRIQVSVREFLDLHLKWNGREPEKLETFCEIRFTRVRATSHVLPRLTSSLLVVKIHTKGTRGNEQVTHVFASDGVRREPLPGRWRGWRGASVPYMFRCARRSRPGKAIVHVWAKKVPCRDLLHNLNSNNLHIVMREIYRACKAKNDYAKHIMVLKGEGEGDYRYVTCFLEPWYFSALVEPNKKLKYFWQVW